MKGLPDRAFVAFTVAEQRVHHSIGVVRPSPTQSQRPPHRYSRYLSQRTPGNLNPWRARAVRVTLQVRIPRPIAFEIGHRKIANSVIVV